MTITIMIIMVMMIMMVRYIIAQSQHNIKMILIQQTMNLLMTYERKWVLAAWKTNYVNFPAVSFLIICHLCEHLHNRCTYNTYGVWFCMARLATARHSSHVDLPSCLDHAPVWPFWPQPTFCPSTLGNRRRTCVISFAMMKLIILTNTITNIIISTMATLMMQLITTNTTVTTIISVSTAFQTLSHTRWVKWPKRN